MADPRMDAVTLAVGRVEGAACWLARLATRAAAVGALAGVVLWWFAAGDRITDWWQGTAVSLLVLGFVLATPLWLWNVRSALTDLVDLPDTLTGVATRRAGRLRTGQPPSRPEGGLLGAAQSVRSVLRDYGDLMGGWGTVVQLVAPSFWLLTALALAAVPVLAVAAGIVALVSSS